MNIAAPHITSFISEIIIVYELFQLVKGIALKADGKFYTNFIECNFCIVRCFQCLIISIVCVDNSNFLNLKLQNMNLSCKVHVLL